MSNEGIFFTFLVPYVGVMFVAGATAIWGHCRYAVGSNWRPGTPRTVKVVSGIPPAMLFALPVYLVTALGVGYMSNHDWSWQSIGVTALLEFLVIYALGLVLIHLKYVNAYETDWLPGTPAWIKNMIWIPLYLLLVGGAVTGIITATT